MKITEEKGSTAIKVIIILVLIALLVGGVVVGVFFIKKKGNGNQNIADQIEDSKGIARLDYIETIDDDDIYIDTNGKITKIDTTISKKEGYIYKNCILVENEDGQEYLVDSKGNNITNPDQYKYYKAIVRDENRVLYQVVKDENYGVINEKGELIVPFENGEYFRYIDEGYFYTYNRVMSADECKYEYAFYDETGKKVYTKIIDNNDIYVYLDEITKLRNGSVIAFIMFKENELYEIVNLSTGEVIEEVKMNQNYNVELFEYGNMLYAEFFEGSTYGDRNNMVRMCYWFGDDKKLIKSQQLTDEGIDSRSYDYIGCVVMSKDGKGVVYKDGEVIYSSDETFSTYEHYDRENDSYTQYFVESTGGREYATYNSKGEKIMDNNISDVGNKYLYGNKVLYNFDGSVAKENVTDYKSVGGIDFIKNEDGVIMENNQVSKKINADVFSAEHIREVDDNYVYVEFKERLFIINQNTLDCTEIEAESSSDYWYIQNGYVRRGNKYYDFNGKQVYVKES